LANPIFEIAWGEGLKELEFSKMYQDGLNPQSGFAAVMVCSEADESCPQVTGADLRVSLTFLDPKVFDESRFETFKYAERRDDIGRIFLAVMANARRQLQAKTVPNHKAAHQNEDRVDFKSPSCP
jgi:arsenate reductase (thioredoxin)